MFYQELVKNYSYRCQKWLVKGIVVLRKSDVEDTGDCIWVCYFLHGKSAWRLWI